MLFVIELTLVVAFLMVWKGLGLILEDKVLIPARARRWREVEAELDAEGLARLDPVDEEAARLAHEDRREAMRERAWAEWERDRAELRGHAERLGFPHGDGQAG